MFAAAMCLLGLVMKDLGDVFFRINVYFWTHSLCKEYIAQVS